jgi:ligand-binding sensor domain-containing protein
MSNTGVLRTAYCVLLLYVIQLSPVQATEPVWTTFTAADGLAPGAVNALAAAPDGVVWAATSQGLSRFDGQIWMTWTSGYGLPDDFVTAVAVGPDGTVWAGTLRGAARLQVSSLRFQVVEGVGQDAITALAVAPDGTAWLGTYGGLIRIPASAANPQTFRQADSDLPADQISALAVTPDGAVWIGTSGQGLARFDGQRWLAFSKQDGLADDFINVVTVGPDGGVWVGTEEGLSVLDGLHWRTFTTADGLPDRRVRAVAVAADGTVWIGTPRGAARLARGAGTFATLSLLTDPFPAAGYLTSAAIDPSGEVWLGGASGVSRFGSSSVERLVRYPVVFVHGWHGPVYQEDSQLRFLRRWLERDGFQVFYATGIDSKLNLDQNAARLRDFINQVKAKTGAEKVHLIGHSMGGLNIRAYVESALYQGDVASVTTLGSPHAGVFLWHDFLVREIAGGSTEPSARELLQEYVTLFNRVHARPDEVPYYLLAGDLAEQEPLKFLDFWPPNDGIISAYSALGLKPWPEQSSNIARILTPSIHGWTSGGIALDLTSYLWPDNIYLTTLRDDWMTGGLLTRSQAWGSDSSQTLPASVLAPPAPLNRTPAIFGNLAPGQVVSHTLTVDATPTARFTLIWRAGQVGLTLLDPAGRRIDPAEALRDPAIEHFSLEADTFANLTIYSVKDPPPGTWTMTLDGRDLLEVVDYAAYVELDNRLRLSASLDAGLYRPGQPMRVSATLRDGDQPVAGATVTAELVGAGPEPTPATLFDDGGHGDGRANDGIYANLLSAPAEGGYYPVTVTARGSHPRGRINPAPGGEGFARGLSVFAVVSPESARLTGHYTARREDADGDGRFERLLIDVGVEARRAGDFAVAVRLTSQDREIARVYLPVHLVAGEQSVAVPFLAQQLVDRAIDGPYDVAEVALMDASGAAVVVDQAENVYRTPAYAVRDFNSR